MLTVICKQSTQNSCPAELQCNQSQIWEGCYLCESMNEGARCTRCNKGRKVDGNGKCVECGDDECCPKNITLPQLTNCRLCGEEYTNCVKCKEGFFIEDGKCTKCGNGGCCPGDTTSPVMKGCYECDHIQQKCLTCPADMKLNGSGMCVECKTDECCWEGNSGRNIKKQCKSCSEGKMGCGSCYMGCIP